jgi:hypothetical protein
MIQPIILGPVETPKSWGSELWLNSAWRGASATVRADGASTLAELLAAQPALLGEWSRRLFGDELPIFTKLLRANFPPFVHVGFKSAIDRQTLLGWLAREQALLRQLFSILDVHSRDAFDAFMRIYSEWATMQAEARWRVDNEQTLAERLTPFARPDGAARLRSWLGLLRWNRSHIVDLYNEIDLRNEDGNLLLTPAGVVHSIFGLSHQTHPIDRARATLQALFRHLKRLVTSGASDEELRTLVDQAGLPELRRASLGAPKNEAWLPTSVGGQRILVEPQQTSDTTFSVADFYTPFVWSRDRMTFRKGEPTSGLVSSELVRMIDGMELSATTVEQIRRVPVSLPGASSPSVAAFRLVDDPVAWPFFTAHRLDFDGRPGAAARWRGDHAPGVFQQLVVLDGKMDIIDAHGHSAELSPSAPAFIPATMTGGYQLVSVGAARALIFSVPSPRGGFAHV